MCGDVAREGVLSIASGDLLAGRRVGVAGTETECGGIFGHIAQHAHGLKKPDVPAAHVQEIAGHAADALDDLLRRIVIRGVQAELHDSGSIRRDVAVAHQPVLKQADLLDPRRIRVRCPVKNWLSRLTLR